MQVNGERHVCPRLQWTDDTQGRSQICLAATDAFVAEVSPGETFEVETELNIGGHLITSLNEKLSLSDVTIPFVNPATGPILVRGAKPGDMVTVDVINVGVHGLGFTALWPGIGIFPDWVRRREFGIQNRNVRVENGIVHWSDSLKLEAKPMIGVIGMAPIAGGVSPSTTAPMAATSTSRR
jgi:amidase